MISQKRLLAAMLLVVALATGWLAGRKFESYVQIPELQCMVDQLQVIPQQPPGPPCDLKAVCVEI